MAGSELRNGETVEVIPAEAVASLREAVEDSLPVIDSVFQYLAESGLAETSIKLYEAIKPLAEIRVRLAEASTQQKD